MYSYFICKSNGTTAARYNWQTTVLLTLRASHYNRSRGKVYKFQDDEDIARFNDFLI